MELMQNPQYRNSYGIILMLIHSLALPMLYVINKYVMKFIHSNQVVFLYKTVVLLGIIPWVLYGGLNCLKTKRLKLHILRGIVSTAGGLLFMYGLNKVDIAGATAMNKMEPILTMIVAALYFKEHLSSAKIVTIILSSVGMLLSAYQFIGWDGSSIYFPWMEATPHNSPSFNYHYLFLLGAALLWTANSSIIKALGTTESNRTQMLYISIISVIVSMPTALCTWEWQTVAEGITLPWVTSIQSITDLGLTTPLMELILLSALMHFLHVACYFQSLKVAEMSTVIPFDYSRLIFGAILGYCVFGEIPTFSAYVGYTMILCSGLYLLKQTSTPRRTKI